MTDRTARLRWLEEMYLGYFSLTMATGIIAIALNLLGMTRLSDVLFALTLFSWVALLCVYAWRLMRFPGAVLADLMNPQLTFNSFSFVAATDIAGILLHIHGHDHLALLCWVTALLAWSALLYCCFAVMTLLHGKRNIRVVDGGWLICVVGTQSLVLLGVKMIPQFGDYTAFALLGIYMLWLLGLILYGVFVTLFCYRFFFLEMNIEDYNPLIWVIMGAAAISSNASSNLDRLNPVIHVLSEMHPLVDGAALLTWTWATWWIPLLAVIGFWKYVVRRVPLRYEPERWNIVFPLGMYSVASYQLSLAAEFEPLLGISNFMVWAAIASWCLLIIGLLRRMTGWFFMKE